MADYDDKAPRPFPFAGVWADCKNGYWYELMTDTIWHKMPDENWRQG